MIFAPLLAAAALMTSPAQSDPSAPVVQTQQGALAGATADGIESFKGVPFAAPPVGPLRWRMPQAPAAWEGERPAVEYGAICIQPPPGGDPGVGPLPMSEDCLTLNVWAPVERSAPLPVMVWIHGGGMNNGSGTAALYDGASLAKRGVIVVTVNYRLGRLGFFAHPGLRAEANGDDARGNFGMADLVASLEWVRDNIAAFGGDPGNVTIFGESAGGAAVTRLMISPPARGLFHRAVVQSGLGREGGTPSFIRRGDGGASLEERGVAFARGAGLGEFATADELRALPAEAMLRPGPTFYGGDLLVIDGRIVPDEVEAAFAAGKQAPVPLIIGTNSAEFWWMKPTDLSPYGETDDALTWDERQAMLGAYGGQGGYDAFVLSDLIFNEPARHLARLHAKAGNPTYLYRFDVVPVPSPEPQHEGATHASERPYVFGTLDTTGWSIGDHDHAASDALGAYWTTFARSGDPNGVGRPEWPDVRTAGDELLEFTNGGPVAKPVPFAERLDLIEAFHRRMAAGL